jgi:hypothetical protein
VHVSSTDNRSRQRNQSGFGRGRGGGGSPECINTAVTVECKHANTYLPAAWKERMEPATGVATRDAVLKLNMVICYSVKERKKPIIIVQTEVENVQLATSAKQLTKREPLWQRRGVESKHPLNTECLFLGFFPYTHLPGDSKSDKLSVLIPVYSALTSCPNKPA